MLDRGISSEDAQIEVHKALFSKAKSTEDKHIFLAKLSEDKHKRNAMFKELNEYISESNYWQQNKYQLKTTYYNQK